MAVSREDIKRTTDRLKKVITECQNGDYDRSSLVLAALVAATLESGSTEYLDAAAAAFAESGTSWDTRNAMLYLSLATGCDYDYATCTFSGTPVLGDAELATGKLWMPIGGKRVDVEWYNLSDASPEEKAVWRKRERARKKAEEIAEIEARQAAAGVAHNQLAPLPEVAQSRDDASTILSDQRRRDDERDPTIRRFEEQNPAPEILGPQGKTMDKNYRGRNPKNTVLTSGRREK